MAGWIEGGDVVLAAAAAMHCLLPDALVDASGPLCLTLCGVDKRRREWKEGGEEEDQSSRMGGEGTIDDSHDNG